MILEVESLKDQRANTAILYCRGLFLFAVIQKKRRELHRVSFIKMLIRVEITRALHALITPHMLCLSKPSCSVRISM